MIDLSNINIGDLLTTFGGLITGGGLAWLFNWRNRMRVAKAEADTAVATGYEARLEECHRTIQYLNQTLAELTQRIRDLNHALNEKTDQINDKTDQIRKLTQQMWEAQQEVNRVQDLLNGTKDTVTRLTEERDEERRLKEYYRRWRCEKSTCLDPEGRRPPNSRLAAETYEHPE